MHNILSKDKEVRFESLHNFASLFGNKPGRLNEPRLIYLLIFIRKGTGHCYIDNQKIPLHPGAILLVNPYSFLHLANTEYLLGNVVLFTEPYFCRDHTLETLLYKVTYDPAAKAFFPLEESQFDFVKSNFDLFGKEYSLTVESELKVRLLHTLLHNCILFLHKLQLLSTGKSYDLEEPFAKSRVVEFIQLLNRHFKEEDNLEFYSNKMNITPKMLIQICKRGIGWAPKAVMQSKLLTESKRLLIFDPQSIGEISIDLGFNDTSSFIRFFSEYAGMTPREFREKNKINEF